MNPGKWVVGILAGLALLQTGVALADQVQKVGTADTKQKFELVAAAVKQEMAAGGRYEFVRGKDLDTVNQRLDEMSSLFNQFGSVDRMDQSTRIRMFNDQEKIDGVLTRDDRNRQVCTRETTLGSNIPHTTCRTYGEVMADHSNTEDALRWAQRMESQNLEITDSPAFGSHLGQSTMKGPGDASH